MMYKQQLKDDLVKAEGITDKALQRIEESPYSFWIVVAILVIVAAFAVWLAW